MLVNSFTSLAEKHGTIGWKDEQTFRFTDYFVVLF